MYSAPSQKVNERTNGQLAANIVVVEAALPDLSNDFGLRTVIQTAISSGGELNHADPMLINAITIDNAERSHDRVGDIMGWHILRYQVLDIVDFNAEATRMDQQID